MKTQEEIKTIDLTPTWEQTMNVLFVLARDGQADGQKIAHEEMLRAGKLLDQFIKEQK